MLPGKKIRVLILLGVLAWVAVDAAADRFNTTDWQQTLWVGVYPVNADRSAQTARYLETLDRNDFAAIEDWLQKEAARHGIGISQPVQMHVGDTMTEMPPLPPRDGGVFDVMRWSLGLRWWADDHDALPGGLKPDIRLYLLYYDPATEPRLAHSLGLQKGLVGIVHLFAHPRQSGNNRVVIAHELLHTLGATDKYDPATSQPLHPHGYAEPLASPLYPQPSAEIMGGRVPQSATKSEIPPDVDATRIGALTASEIRWR